MMETPPDPLPQIPSSGERKPRLFILTFSHLPRDGRVLRQIKALAPYFDVTAAGLDDDPAEQLPGVSFKFVKLERRRSAAGKALRLLSYAPGAILPQADFWPWTMTSEYRQAKAAVRSGIFDAMLCNDLNAVLLGVEMLREKGIPFVADYHEFPAGEATEKLSHRWFKGPHGHRCLKRYGRLAAGSLTVNQPFAGIFRRDYGFAAHVVLNAPELRPLPAPVPRNDDALHVVYHGMGGANRNVDVLIRAAGMTKRNVLLHLMLVTEESWLEGMRRLAAEAAPGRVKFHPPVAPDQISQVISRYDIGLWLPHGHSVNNLHALPNKLFEYVHAGLAVCCTSVPALAGFIGDWGNGWLLENADSGELAALLDTVSPADLAAKKQASLKAREVFHAGRETEAMVQMLRGITSGSQQV